MDWLGYFAGKYPYTAQIWLNFITYFGQQTILESHQFIAIGFKQSYFPFDDCNKSTNIFFDNTKLTFN